MWIGREDWSLPIKVSGLDHIHVKAVAGSGVVSIAVAEDGSAWSWGRSKRGQLGLGPGVTDALLPTRIQALKGRHVLQVLKSSSDLLLASIVPWSFSDAARLVAGGTRLGTCLSTYF